ncbi:MAG: hypothetical protein EPN93_19935 [Spirochaetes bacterium]|nr:MAG: hypothetical protein EPN93_19935 [Spirochaetota bacterium]
MNKLERKDVIKLAGGAVLGTAVGTVFSGAPFLGLQWLVEWTQDQYVPGSGDEKFIASICQSCSNKCNLSIRMIGNRAVKVETSNSACPVGANALQLLYHPERIRQPLKKVGGKGNSKFKPVSWDEAIKDISAKAEKLKSENKGAAIAAINGQNAGLSGQLLARLLKTLGSASCFVEPGLATLSAAAVKATQDIDGSLHYDFENSDYILSFGARLVEGWGEPSRMNKVFAGWKARKAKYVQVDTICTRSASIADQWVPVKAGSEAALALGIAYYLMKMGRGSNAANFGELAKIINADFTPEKVSQLTGLKPEAIEQIAKDLAGAGNAVAVAGRGGWGVSSSTAEFVAVQAVNSLIGSLGRRGGVQVAVNGGLGEPAVDAAAAESIKKAKKQSGLDDYIKNGVQPELLFVNEADPVFKSVYGAPLAEKMEKTAMVVAFLPLINDTAQYADYIFPTLSWLEIPAAKGKDAAAVKTESKHAADAILQIAKKIKGSDTAFAWNSFKDIIAAAGKTEIRGAGNLTIPADVMKAFAAELPKKLAPAKDFPLAMIPFEAALLGDGDGLAFPYVLKGLDDTTLTGRKMWVLMNPETAKKHGASEGSRVDLESKRGEVGSVKVHLTKTIAPDVVAVPLGFGHKAYTSYAKGKGVNPKLIMSNDIDSVSGAADWWYTSVKLS